MKEWELAMSILVLVHVLPLGRLDVSPEGRGLSETKWSDGGTLVRSLVLDSSSCNVTANPRSDVLVNFDHNEEDDAVDDDHAEENAEIHPLGSAHVNLENIFQDVFSGNLRKVRGLVVEDQAFEIILVLALKKKNVRH